jgi:CBS domain-containing protein
MRVGDMVSPEAYAVSPDDTLREAARLMADLDAGALPVGENDQLIGTITDRDIALQVVAEGRDPETVTVGQAMSSDVLYCFENESVEDVSEKMRHWWVRRLPVVSPDKRLIGIVSLGDLTALEVQQPRARMRMRKSPKQSAPVSRRARGTVTAS